MDAERIVVFNIMYNVKCTHMFQGYEIWLEIKSFLTVTKKALYTNASLPTNLKYFTPKKKHTHNSSSTEFDKLK